MVDAPERIWAWKYTGGFNRGEWAGQKSYGDAVEYIRADHTLSDAVQPKAERSEPVASVAEVRADGQRLYNTVYPSDALDKFPIGTLLYTTPPTSELEALRKRVAELEKALEKSENLFAAISHHIDEHSFSLALGFCSQGAFIARRVREGGKVE